jgi:hypothetical protein
MIGDKVYVSTKSKAFYPSGGSRAFFVYSCFTFSCILCTVTGFELAGSFGCERISGIFEKDNMDILRAVMLVAVVILSGCAHNRENNCKQECTSKYIECTQGLRIYSMIGCKEIYESCISTCSSK